MEVNEPFSFHYQNEKGTVRRTQALFEGSDHSNQARCIRRPLPSLVRKQITVPIWFNKVCPTCQGARLKEEMLHVRIGGKNIDDVIADVD